FVGRETDAEAFRNRLRIESMLVVVGPSGSGKSSFVQAGVLGELGDDWGVLVVRPGPDPLALWTETIEPFCRAATEPRVVVVIDQAEELFTLCSDDTARKQVADSLVRLAGPRVRVVFTLRDDFLVRAAALLGNLDRVLHLLVSPGRDDLRRILVEPAR